MQQQYVLTDSQGKFVARFDLAIPSLRLGIEAHSREFHFGPIRRSCRRGPRLARRSSGWEVLYLGWYAQERPARVVARVAQICAARRVVSAKCVTPVHSLRVESAHFRQAAWIRLTSGTSRHWSMSWAVRSSASSDVSLCRLAVAAGGIDWVAGGSMLDDGLQGVRRIADAGEASTIAERDQHRLMTRRVARGRDQPEPVDGCRTRRRSPMARRRSRRDRRPALRWAWSASSRAHANSRARTNWVADRESGIAAGVIEVEV